MMSTVSDPTSFGSFLEGEVLSDEKGRGPRDQKERGGSWYRMVFSSWRLYSAASNSPSVSRGNRISVDPLHHTAHAMVRST